jgi:2-C-methyl-D-erythritol 4-phosphate cytidylyltransferase
MTVAVIIVAAGRGRRLGGEIPKQFLDLGSSTAFRRSIEAFLSVHAIGHVVPVIHPDDRALCDTALQGLDDVRLLPAVEGGETRALSVRQGLERLAPEHPDLVLIHDAARPFVPVTVIEDVISALSHSDGACAALPVVDALWRSDNGVVGAPVSRDGLWRAQTPQGFRFDSILAAHRAHDGSGADDITITKEAGLTVRFVHGSEQSYKITTAADLERARFEVDARGSR